MEKKIVFTPVEPNKNLLWLHYKNGLLVLQRFGSNGWEDITNSDQITEAEVMELIKDKANLVGGKVPAEELPSYVDDVIEFNNIQVADAEISSIIGNNLYKNRIRFVNNSTTLPDRIGSEDKYPNMFVNFGENTSEDDWTTFEPEEGKIYVNTTNNHSYRWSGSYLIDLDSNWSQGIKDLQENTVRTDIQTLSADKQKQVFENLGWKVYVSTSDVIIANAAIPDDVMEEIVNCQAILLSDTGKMLFKGNSDNNLIYFLTFGHNNNVQELVVRVVDKKSQSLQQSPINDQYAIKYSGKQNLTTTQQDVSLNNIGLDFVHVDYSLLGTTLTDAQVESISNSRGIILTNGTNYDGPTVFIKGHAGSTGQLFFAQDASSVVRQININLNNKTLSTVSSIELHFDSVRYEVTQTLTNTQKQKARTNIGVQSADELLEDADFIAQLKTKLETV